MEENNVDGGRRSESRYREDCDVQLLRETDAPVDGAVAGFCNDLSVDGASVVVPKTNWKIGDSVVVSFYLPFPFQRMSARGIVQWLRSEGQRDIVGLKFSDAFGGLIVLRDYLSREVMSTRHLNDRRSLSENGNHLPDKLQQKMDRRTAGRKIDFKNDSTSPEAISSTNNNHLESPTHSLLFEIPLLIGGNRLYTGKVEYYPYVEKMISDEKETRLRLARLRKGGHVEDYSEYICAKYHVALPDTNQQAIDAAYEASQEFRLLPLQRRHKIMSDIYDLLIEKKDRLIELMVTEGHPVSLAQWEYEGMLAAFNRDTLDFYKKEMLKEMGSKELDEVFIIRRPDGVVCLVPPRNAPCSIPIIAAFSLLAGNTMIVKPPLRSPVSCSYLWQDVIYAAARANGAPPGVINTVVGNSEMIMKEWLESPRVDDIFFFGDSKPGLEIGYEAFRHGKKPILELSGNDFMLVWNDAPLEAAVDSLVDGLKGSLQICMAAKKAFVHPDVFDEFCSLVVKAVESRAKVGLPSDPKVYLTPVARLRECEQVLHRALNAGAELLTGGRRVNHLNQPSTEGPFFEATVIGVRDSDPMRHECVVEENFFPLLPLVSLPRKESWSDSDVFSWMIESANRNQYGLRISIWARSKQWISRFAQNVSNCGLLRINAPHTGFSKYLSVNGGGKKSGGPFGEMNYPWLKTSHLQGITIRW